MHAGREEFARPSKRSVVAGDRGRRVSRARWCMLRFARVALAAVARAREEPHAIEGVDAMGQPYLQETNVCIYGSES